MPFGPSDRRALSLLAVLLSTAPASLAQSESPIAPDTVCPPVAPSVPRLQIALDYRVAPELTDCPSQAELAAAIAQRLGYDPFADVKSRPRRLLVALRPTATGTEADVVWFDKDGNRAGERRLTSESSQCAELARGLIFAVSVQIQLRAAEPGPPGLPAAPPPAPPRQPAPSPPPPPAKNERLVMVGAGALVSHGLTPGLAAGIRVFGSIANGWGAVELDTEGTLPTEYQREGQGFSARELSARLSPCLRFSFARTCLVGMLGQLHVRGTGVDQVQSPMSLIGGAGARVQLMWPALPALGLITQVEALALLTPRTVELNRQDVWSTAPVVIGASMDLAAIFR